MIKTMSEERSKKRSKIELVNESELDLETILKEDEQNFDRYLKSVP